MIGPLGFSHKNQKDKKKMTILKSRQEFNIRVNLRNKFIFVKKNRLFFKITTKIEKKVNKFNFFTFTLDQPIKNAL